MKIVIKYDKQCIVNYVAYERPSAINDRDEGNKEFLKSKKDFTKCDKVTISEIKMGLRNFGVPCRV